MALNVLVIAPHPDDEAIGCGGTICWHVARGDHVEVLFVTGGEAGVPKDMATDTDACKAIRHREAGQASYCLHSHQLYMLGLIDGLVNGLDTRLHMSLVQRIRDGAFTRVFGPSEHDNHPDHQATAMAISHARHDVAFELWQYEVWTPHRAPNEFVDITPFVTAKRAAIRGYKSQLANDFEGAILALNHYRGILNGGGSGVMYAEAFYRT